MSSGTREALAIRISDEQALDLWQVVDGHASRHGACPVCQRRSPCRPRADAVAELILAGRLDQPRPTVPAR